MLCAGDGGQPASLDPTTEALVPSRAVIPIRCSADLVWMPVGCCERGGRGRRDRPAIFTHAPAQRSPQRRTQLSVATLVTRAAIFPLKRWTCPCKVTRFPPLPDCFLFSGVARTASTRLTQRVPLHCPPSAAIASLCRHQPFPPLRRPFWRSTRCGGRHRRRTGGGGGGRRPRPWWGLRWGPAGQPPSCTRAAAWWRLDHPHRREKGRARE